MNAVALPIAVTADVDPVDELRLAACFVFAHMLSPGSGDKRQASAA